MSSLRGLARGFGVGLGLLSLGVAALWWAGPPGLATGPYVQRVTPHSAVIARIDREASRISVVVQGGEDGAPIEVREVLATREHALRVEGLRPGTRYRYRLETSGLGAEGQFRTPPVDDRAPVLFAAVGDSGAMPWWFNGHALGWARLRPLLAWTSRSGQWDVARWIAASDPDFFVHLGDIVYWPGHLRDAHEEAFFRPFAPILSHAALFTLLGNHDIPAELVPPPFDSIFHNPEGGPPGRSYSFAWGSVRIVVAQTPAGWWQEDSPLHEWVDRTLAEAREPWLVVATHTPCQSAVRPEKVMFQKALCRLVEERGVDLVISGDDHLYQRFEPRVPGGPIQITAGGGGKDIYEHDEAHATLAAAAPVFGFLQVEVRGALLIGRALGAEGVVLDEFRIDRRAGGLPPQLGAPRRARLDALRD